MIKINPTARDLEKANGICSGAALVLAIDPVNGLEALVESVAQALAAERASLPESVERALAYTQVMIGDCIDKVQLNLWIVSVDEALEDLRKWKAGEE